MTAHRWMGVANGRGVVSVRGAVTGRGRRDIGGLSPSVPWGPVGRWLPGVRVGRGGRGILERRRCLERPADSGDVTDPAKSLCPLNVSSVPTVPPSAGSSCPPAAQIRPCPPALEDISVSPNNPPATPPCPRTSPCPSVSSSIPQCPPVSPIPEYPTTPRGPKCPQIPQHLLLSPGQSLSPSPGAHRDTPSPPPSPLTADPLAPGMPSVPGFPYKQIPLSSVPQFPRIQPCPRRSQLRGQRGGTKPPGARGHRDLRGRRRGRASRGSRILHGVPGHPRVLELRWVPLHPGRGR